MAKTKHNVLRNIWIKRKLHISRGNHSKIRNKDKKGNIQGNESEIKENNQKS